MHRTQFTTHLLVLILSSLGLVTSSCTREAPQKNNPGSGSNTYQKITGDDTDDERERWNTLFKTNKYIFGKDPTPFLRDHVHMLPVGRALVMPMEEGRNAVFLAKHGFIVSGVDFSEVALQKANRLAKENNVKITSINADLNFFNVEAGVFDVIVDIDFHRPRLVEQIKRGLKSGGVVVYHVVSQNIVGPTPNLSTKEGDLKPGQLRTLFSDFQILVYQEDLQGGERVSNLIAKKP